MTSQTPCWRFQVMSALVNLGASIFLITRFGGRMTQWATPEIVGGPPKVLRDFLPPKSQSAPWIKR